MNQRLSKKLVSLSLMGTLLFSQAMPAMAIEQSFEVQNTVQQTSYAFSYEVNEDGTGITITYLPTDYAGELTIPSTIDSLPVTTIGDNDFMNSGAFKGCTGLTSVTIPDSVTSIGDSTFEGCTGLTSVTIPDSVTSIGNFAFSDCAGLTSITIPNSVTSIDSWTFEGCTNLTSITIPDSVTSIGYGAFGDCTDLTSITIPDSVTTIGDNVFDNTSWYNAQPDGIVYLNNWLIDYKGDMPENTEITIKDGVAYIADCAFKDCTGLTSIAISDSITSIGYAAFCDCTGLTSITIPDSVTSIGYATFWGCTDLTSITIPDSVTSIGAYVIDSHGTELESDIFKECENLTIYCSEGSHAQSNAKEFDINYVIIEFPEETTGDTNGDGAITAKDSAVVLQCVSQMAQLTAEQIKLADMNGDSVVTAKDSAMILQKIASL